MELFMQKKSRVGNAEEQNHCVAGEFLILGMNDVTESVRNKILAAYAILPLEVSAWLEYETDFSESHVNSMIGLLLDSAECDSCKN